jgi:ketosteroid isomerase-like protein
MTIGKNQMKGRFFISRLIAVAMIMAGCIGIITGQTISNVDATKDLYNRISGLDSLLFTAFNTRDVERFKELFTEDLEFFHDKGGLTNYDNTINSLKETVKINNGLRRELVKGSMEVYPIPGYGAMQIGAHTFCHQENGKQDCGTFKFVHIWQQKNGEWKIARVISYGH